MPRRNLPEVGDRRRRPWIAAAISVFTWALAGQARFWSASCETLQGFCELYHQTARESPPEGARHSLRQRNRLRVCPPGYHRAFAQWKEASRAREALMMELARPVPAVESIRPLRPPNEQRFLPQ